MTPDEAMKWLMVALFAVLVIAFAAVWVVAVIRFARGDP